MKPLYLFNTLSHKKEEFKILPQPSSKLGEGVIGVYTCGPTVYNFAHIGNLRSYIFADILVRALRYNYGEGKIKWLMNITDVDDKTIRDSKTKYPDLDPKKALQKFTEEYEKYFWLDTEKLNIQKPDKITHATDYIEEMQKLARIIVEAGYGYVKDGSVYFDVKKFSQNHKYGNLINLDMDGFKAGARVDLDEYEKENVQDFVLWKGKKEGEPFWDFSLNDKSLPGRPGWHIECSAMGEAELGCPFDIHTGGIDLKFPHHENEIAQSVIGYKCEKPVNYWLHNEHLLVDGQRMGKRFKNFNTVNDLKNNGVDPLAYRFLCLQTNYGKQMNFTWEALKSAQEGLEHIYNQYYELEKNIDSKVSGIITEKESEEGNIIIDEFIDAINDDLNTTKALAILQKVFKSKISNKNKLCIADKFDQVLGLNLINGKTNDLNAKLPEDIIEKGKERYDARKEKRFEESDRLRDEIEKLGYIVEDTKDGQRIYKK